ncbi:MAG: DUF11 domain-containing protein [Bacteroidales bacterium]|nr:DUF11 domain-containing protein [Bacteroidales bacterium]
MIKTSTTSPNTYATVGDVLTYDIVVTNTGNVTISGVAVSDPDADAPPERGSDQVGNNDNLLEVGEIWTYTATHTVTQGDINAGSFTNTATATGTPAGGTLDDASDSETVDATQAPELTTTKAANPSGQTYYAVGDVLTYTITVENTGNVTITDIVVTDPNADTSPLSCTDTDLAPGENFTCSAQHTITQSDLDAGFVTNTATAAGEDSNGDTVSDESNEVIIEEATADLTMSKTGPASVVAGEQITYTLDVENLGPSDAQDVVITDAVNSDISGAEYSVDGTTWITWTGTYAVGTLTAGSTFTLYIRGTVNPDVTGGVTNTASVTSSTDDPDPDNSSDTEVTPVTTSADLTMSKTGPANVVAGEQITYTLDVENLGPSDAQDVVITDTVSSDISGAEYSIDGTTWTTWTGTYTVGTLSAGDTFSLYIQGTVNPDVGDSITNTASVSSSTIDPDTTNNSDTVNTVALHYPTILGANGLPAADGYIPGLETCEGNDLTICLDVFDPDGDQVNISSITILTSNGSTIYDPDPNDLCFDYIPAANFTGTDSVEIVVCDNGLISLCDTVIAIIDVINNPVAFAGPDAIICENEFYFIASSEASYYSGLLWTTEGDGLFNDTTILHPEYIPGPEDIVSGEVNLILTAFANSPCNVAAVDTMTLLIQPGPMVEAGEDETICENELFETQGFVNNAYGTLWTTAGDGYFDDPTIMPATYYPGANDISNGFVLLTLTANPVFPCTEPVSDDMILTITLSATADAGNDAGICEGDVYSVTGASALNYSGLLWSSNGDGSFNETGILDPVYTPGTNDISSGIVILSLTAYGIGSCSDATDEMTLIITPLPLADAGSDADICEGDEFVITGSTASNYSSLLWSSNGDGIFDDAGILHPVYSPGSNDISSGTVTLTLTAFGLESCADASDSMILTITLLPESDAGNDAAICEGDDYILSDASASNYSNLLWSTSGDGDFDDTGILHPVYTPGINDISSGNVALSLTAFGMGTCGEVTDNMTISITPLPEANAGSDADICEVDDYTLSDATAINYSSLTWSTSGDGTFDDFSILHPVYTPGINDISSGAVTLTLTAQGMGPCADTADDMMLSIIHAASAFAGEDGAICQGDDYLLTDATAANYSSLLWSTNGDGVFNDIGLLNPVYTPGVNDISSGTVTLRLTVTGEPPCGDAFDEMDITIFPEPEVYAGEDIIICESDSYSNVDAEVANYESLVWATSGSGLFDDPEILHPTYLPSTEDIQNGSVELILFVSGVGSCEDKSDTLLLNFDLSPVVYAGPDDVVCEGSSYTINDASADNYTALLWNHNGSGVLQNSNTLTPTYMPAPGESGQIEFVLRASGSAYCNDALDTMILVIHPAPFVYAGVNADICGDESYYIEDALADNYSSLSWATSGTGSFDDPLSLNPTYYPSVMDIAEGSVVLTLSVNGIGPCPLVADNMILDITTSPSVDAGLDAQMCEGDAYAIFDASADAYSGILWSTSGDGQFDDNSVVNPIYTPGVQDISSGSVVLTLIAYGFDPCGDAIDEKVITIFESPNADAGNDQWIQINTSTMLEGNASGGSGLYSYIWEPSELLIDSFIPYPVTVDLIVDTLFILTVVDINTGCQDVDSVWVHLIETPPPPDPPVAVDDYDTTQMNIPVVIDVLANDTIPEGSTVTVTICGNPLNGFATVNDDGTITYEPYFDFYGDDSFCYSICDDNDPPQCDSATVYIHIPGPRDIEDNITIYNGFSPNGDGVNDFFHIDGIELYPDNKVVMFNRWGDLIIDFERYDNTIVKWDGENKKGELLPDGTYFYLIKIKFEGIEKIFSGWVFISGVN